MRRRGARTLRRCIGPVLGASWLLASVGEARAQAEKESEAPAEPDPGDVTLPRALDTTVAYPENAEGAAQVDLELVIDEIGHVTSVRVILGPPVFSDAARDAAFGWRFEPARRGGQPIAARIRFRVEFVQPEVPAEPSEPAPEPIETPAEVTGDVEPEYVITVTGQRPTPGASTLGRATVREIPGAFGDPFRAIEVQPGIAPVASGVPFFFVRGAPPGNLGYLIDDIPIPLLFHGFIGPAVMHPEMIERVDLHRGGYPARYGRYAGGVVTAQTVPPPTELHGRVNVRLVDSGAYLASPFAGGKGHATAAGRYSYTALILSLVTDAVLEYWDYQARLSYDVTPRDKLTLFGFGAKDFISDDKRESFAGTDFHRLDLRYDRKVGSESTATLAVTGGSDRSQATNGTITAQGLRLRGSVDLRANERVRVRAGSDGNLDRFGLTLTDEARRDIEVLFPTRNEAVFGSYVDITWNPEPWITVEPGIRADLYRSLGNQELGIDPRLAASFEVNQNWRLIHAFGIAHQAPNFVPSLPGARVGGIRGGLQRGVQASAGAEVELPEDVTATVTVFGNMISNLSDPLGFSRTISADIDAVDIRALGYTYGLETYVIRDFSRKFFGTFSYTLSRSVRSHGRLETLSAFDRTHVATATAGYRAGKGWTVGARITAWSGVPVRRLTVDGPQFTGDDRGSPFFRLDLRAEKRWVVSENLWWAVNAEMLNATASQEVVGRSCNPIRCTDSVVGPLILPSVGVEVGF